MTTLLELEQTARGGLAKATSNMASSVALPASDDLEALARYGLTKMRGRAVPRTSATFEPSFTPTEWGAFPRAIGGAAKMSLGAAMAPGAFIMGGVEKTREMKTQEGFLGISGLGMDWDQEKQMWAAAFKSAFKAMDPRLSLSHPDVWGTTYEQLRETTTGKTMSEELAEKGLPQWLAPIWDISGSLMYDPFTYLLVAQKIAMGVGAKTFGTAWPKLASRGARARFASLMGSPDSTRIFSQFQRDLAAARPRLAGELADLDQMTGAWSSILETADEMVRYGPNEQAWTIGGAKGPKNARNFYLAQMRELFGAPNEEAMRLWAAIKRAYRVEKDDKAFRAAWEDIGRMVDRYNLPAVSDQIMTKLRLAPRALGDPRLSELHAATRTAIDELSDTAANIRAEHSEAQMGQVMPPTRPDMARMGEKPWQVETDSRGIDFTGTRSPEEEAMRAAEVGEDVIPPNVVDTTRAGEIIEQTELDTSGLTLADEAAMRADELGEGVMPPTAPDMARMRERITQKQGPELTTLMVDELRAAGMTDRQIRGMSSADSVDFLLKRRRATAKPQSKMRPEESGVVQNLEGLRDELGVPGEFVPERVASSGPTREMLENTYGPLAKKNAYYVSREGRTWVKFADGRTRSLDNLAKEMKAAKPTVTLDATGMQQIFEMVNKRLAAIRQAHPLRYEPIGPDELDGMWRVANREPRDDMDAFIARATQGPRMAKVKRFLGKDPNTGKQVHRWDKVPLPRVVETTLSALLRAKELDKGLLGLKLFRENPIRLMEAAGSEIKAIFYYPVRDALDLVARERRQFEKKIKDLGKGVDQHSRNRIGVFAIGQQNSGKARLAAQGITEIPTLSAKELGIYKAMRVEFESFGERINAVRESIGKAPLYNSESGHKIENYFTFLHDLGQLEAAGKPVMELSSDSVAKFAKASMTRFRFAEQRAKGVPPGMAKLETDAFHVLSTYAHSAIKHIHVSPVLAQHREYLKKFHVLGKGGKAQSWRLADTHPNLYSFLHHWINHVAGIPTKVFGPKVEKALTRLNRNMVYAVLSGSVRSALIQPTALRNTAASIGMKWTLAGIGKILRQGTVKGSEAMKKSKTLFGRQYDVSVADLQHAIAVKSAGGVQRGIGRFGLKPLQWLDKVTAAMTWEGAYEQARRALKMGEKAAIRYADDVVVRTQASASEADIARIQYSAAGRAATLFQTFVINDWNFLVKDVIGSGAGKKFSRPAIERICTYVGASIALNTIYEDGLNMYSPLATPMRAFKEAIDEDLSSWEAVLRMNGEVVAQLPMLGSAYYGSSMFGAGVQSVQDLLGAAVGRRGRQPAWEAAARLGGVPWSGQIIKGGKAIKRGEPWLNVPAGKPTKEQIKAAKRLPKPVFGGY